MLFLVLPHIHPISSILTSLLLPYGFGSRDGDEGNEVGEDAGFMSKETGPETRKGVGLGVERIGMDCRMYGMFERTLR